MRALGLYRERRGLAAGSVGDYREERVAKLTVSIAGVDYDRTRAIFDGTIGIEGCETICCAMSPEEAFHRAFRYQEFDITELSLSNTMNLVAKGACPYVGIPVFPSRLFRHSSIYIRTDRGIDRPQDLRGKVVGVPEYQMTAAVWIRGILQDEYGVRAAEVKWRNGGLEQPGREPRVRSTCRRKSNYSRSRRTRRCRSISIAAGSTR